MHKIVIVSLASLLLSVTTVSGQSPPATAVIPRAEAHEFVSKLNGRAYTVLVSLPRTYSGDTSARFPVIYLTDANWLFGLTAQSYHLLRLGGMVPDALIVGIVRSGVEEDTREGSAVGAERAFDLTPTRSIDEERQYSQDYKRDVRTGGGPAFLRVVTEELIPNIEARYRANGDRTLIGYSLGGLFGAYALFQAPETFRRMVLVSPSLWWDGGVISKQEQAYADNHKKLGGASSCRTASEKRTL